MYERNMRIEGAEDVGMGAEDMPPSFNTKAVSDGPLDEVCELGTNPHPNTRTFSQSVFAWTLGSGQQNILRRI